MPENFLEVNGSFALTSYCNTIGQSNNAFSILGFLWWENEEAMFWSFHPLADETNNERLPKPFFKVIRKSLYWRQQFVVDFRPYTEKIFSGCLGFPFLSEMNISKFQFDSDGWTKDNLVDEPPLNCYLFINLFVCLLIYFSIFLSLQIIPMCRQIRAPWFASHQ